MDLSLSPEQVLRAYLAAHADTFDVQKSFPALPEQWKDVTYPYDQFFEAITADLNRMIEVIALAHQHARTLYEEAIKDFLSEKEVSSWALVEAKRLHVQPCYYTLFQEQCTKQYIAIRNTTYEETLHDE